MCPFGGAQALCVLRLVYEVRPCPRETLKVSGFCRDGRYVYWIAGSDSESKEVSRSASHG